MSVLPDTDVYSYLARGDARPEPYAPCLRGRTLCLSFASVAEIDKGAYEAGWGAPRLRGLEAPLRNVVVPFDFELSRTCGELMAATGRTGRRMHEFDAWIAATALRHDLPLGTNNQRDFNGVPAFGSCRDAGLARFGVLPDALVLLSFGAGTRRKGAVQKRGGNLRSAASHD